MKKRKVAAPLSEQELNRFIDDLDNDDGLLSDCEILLESEDDISESESDVELNVEEIEDVRLVAPQQRPRKNLLRNFEETLDENNYDQLPPQDEQTFIHPETRKLFTIGRLFTTSREEEEMKISFETNLDQHRLHAELTLQKRCLTCSLQIA